MSAETQDYWLKHYENVFAAGDRWLDYKGEPMQSFTFAVALGAAGSIWNRTCLDAGCGRGQFSLALAAFGARKVVGIDFIKPAVTEQQARYPHVRWEAGSIADADFVASLGDFDLVFLLEVLQYVPYRDILRQMWERVNSGGRLIGVVPNGANPYVEKVKDGFEGRYAPPGSTEIQELLAALTGVASWGIQGMHWRGDQSLMPYDLSPVAMYPQFKEEPKRLLFLAVKA